MDLVALAKRIRSVREQRKMTAQALAQRAGVSKSLISRLENFRITPSLPVLLRIAEALGVSAGKLLDDVPAAERGVIVVRKDERRPLLRNPERAGLRYYELAGTESNKMMVPFVIQLSPSTQGYKPMPHEGDEFNLVIKGGIRFKVGRKEYVLKTGDSIYFGARTPHSISCVGKTNARMLSIICGMGATPAP